MYQEKRPTCVTVIGWTWIIIGGMMCMSAVMALIVSFLVMKSGGENPDLPLIFRIVPLIVPVQLGVAILGLVSGIHFLKLKIWARNVLEGLSWLIFIFIFGFGVFWVYEWMSISSGHGPGGGDTMGLVMGVVITGIYAVPLGIMLKYLRGDKVKNVFNGIHEQIIDKVS